MQFKFSIFSKKKYKMLISICILMFVLLLNFNNCSQSGFQSRNITEFESRSSETVEENHGPHLLDDVTTNAEVASNTEVTTEINTEINTEISTEGNQTTSSATSATSSGVMPIASLSQADTRRLMWFDPALPFNKQPTDMVRQFTGISTSITLESPEGIFYNPASDWVYWITQDPADSSKKALRHRIRNDFPMWNGQSWRAELSQEGSINVNQDFWIAYAVYFPSNQIRGFINILNLHHDNWSVPGVAPRAPIDTLVDDAKSLNIGAFGAWSDYSHYPNNQPPGTYCNVFGNDVNKVATGNPELPKDKWIYLIFKGRLTLDQAHQPYLKVWMATQSDNLKLVCDIKNKPIGYYNMPAQNNYLKFGLYSLEAQTTFTKGIRFLRDSPGIVPALDQHVLLKSIMN